MLQMPNNKNSAMLHSSQRNTTDAQLLSSGLQNQEKLLKPSAAKKSTKHQARQQN